MIPFICEIYKIIEVNLFTKQTQIHRHRKETDGYQRRKVWGDIN